MKRNLSFVLFVLQPLVFAFPVYPVGSITPRSASSGSAGAMSGAPSTCDLSSVSSSEEDYPVFVAPVVENSKGKRLFGDAIGQIVREEAVAASLMNAVAVFSTQVSANGLFDPSEHFFDHCLLSMSLNEAPIANSNFVNDFPGAMASIRREFMRTPKETKTFDYMGPEFTHEHAKVVKDGFVTKRLTSHRGNQYVASCSGCSDPLQVQQAMSYMARSFSFFMFGKGEYGTFLNISISRHGPWRPTGDSLELRYGNALGRRVSSLRDHSQYLPPHRELKCYFPSDGFSFSDPVPRDFKRHLSTLTISIGLFEHKGQVFEMKMRSSQSSSN